MLRAFHINVSFLFYLNVSLKVSRFNLLNMSMLNMSLRVQNDLRVYATLVYVIQCFA